MESFENLLGPAAAFSASITWAVGVLAYSRLSEYFPAYVINFTRLLVGFPFLLLIFFLQQDPAAILLSTTSEHVLWSTIAVLSSYAFGDSLFLIGAKYMGGPGALAIASIYPMWSAIGGFLFKGEALSGKQCFAILVIIAATVAVILAGSNRKKDSDPKIAREEKAIDKVARKRPWLGPLAALGCSIFWAMNSYSVAKLGAELNASYVNLMRFSLGLFLCPLVGILMNGKQSFQLIPKKQFMPVLPIFLVECVGGPFFYAYGLGHSSLAVGATLSSLAPVISVPLALALKREKFSVVKTAGVMGVIFGVWLLF